MNESPRYRIEVTKVAQKVIRKLPRPLANRVRRAIDSLEKEPRPPGYKKLTTHDNLYRIRVGSLRIIYTIEDDALIVLVLKVAPRGAAYRNLR